MISNTVVFLNGERGLLVLRALVSEFGPNAIAVAVTDHTTKVTEEEVALLGCRRLVKVANVNDKDFLSEIRLTSPKLFVVAGFSQIFKTELLEVPELGTINLHAGPLPKYRGGSPLNWQIINGETNIGLSIIEMDEGVDTGSIYAEASFQLGDSENIDDAHRKANELFCVMAVDTVRKIWSGKATKREQPEKDSTYWHQRNDRDGQLDCVALNAKKALNTIRALTSPYPGAWIQVDGKIIRVWSACSTDISIKGTPGKIIYLQGAGPFLIMNDEAIKITNYSLTGGDKIKLKHGNMAGY